MFQAAMSAPGSGVTSSVTMSQCHTAEEIGQQSGTTLRPTEGEVGLAESLCQASTINMSE